MLPSDLAPYLPKLLTHRRDIGALALHADPDQPPATACFGRIQPPFTADSIFEIGSLTKLFTGALLARLVAAGRLALDDPISDYLPLAPGSTNITVLDLATHHAGLPKLPPDLRRFSLDPYADYTRARLLAWLENTSLRSAGSSPFRYSNLGYALLGGVMEAAGGSEYANLLADHILQPLALSNTAVVLNSQQQARFVQGHHLSGRPAPPWRWDAFAPCGGLKSNAADLLAFARAFFADPVLAGTLQPRADCPGGRIGLPWLLPPSGLAWHNGATFGSTSCLLLDPRTQSVSILLANCMVLGAERSILRLVTGLAPSPHTPALPLLQSHLRDLLRPVLRLVSR